MDDTTKRALAPAAQAFIKSVGDALAEAHSQVNGASGDAAEAGASLDHFHKTAEAHQNNIVALFTLADGTQTVQPYDGGGSKGPAS